MTLDKETETLVAPLTNGRMSIGFIDAIHGDGGKATLVEVTRSEVEQLVLSYLKDIARIYFLGAVGYSGSWEIRWPVYASRRIDAFVKAGLISEEQVEELAAKADEPYREYVQQRRAEARTSILARAVVGEVGAAEELERCDSMVPVPDQEELFGMPGHSDDDDLDEDTIDETAC